MISANANVFDAETRRRGENQEKKREKKKDKGVKRPDHPVLFCSSLLLSFFLDFLRVSASPRQDFLCIS